MAHIQTRKSISVSAKAFARGKAAAELADMPLSAYTERALENQARADRGEPVAGWTTATTAQVEPTPTPAPELTPRQLAVPIRKLIEEPAPQDGRPSELDDLVLEEAAGGDLSIEYDEDVP